jgi:hypothetical protein
MLSEVFISGQILNNMKSQVDSFLYDYYVSNYTFFPVDRERVYKFFLSSLNYDSAFYCIKDEKILGILGYEYNLKSFINIDFITYIKEFGFKEYSKNFFNLRKNFKKSSKNILNVQLLTSKEEYDYLGLEIKMLKKLFEFTQKKAIKNIQVCVEEKNSKFLNMYKEMEFKFFKSKKNIHIMKKDISNFRV